MGVILSNEKKENKRKEKINKACASGARLAKKSWWALGWSRFVSGTPAFSRGPRLWEISCEHCKAQRTLLKVFQQAQRTDIRVEPETVADAARIALAWCCPTPFLYCATHAYARSSRSCLDATRGRMLPWCEATYKRIALWDAAHQKNRRYALTLKALAQKKCMCDCSHKCMCTLGDQRLRL